MGIEKYLLEIKNFKYRQAVTRLRVSAHRLPVEIGRYKKISYCDRKCKLCDQGEVGNEQHLRDRSFFIKGGAGVFAGGPPEKIVM